MAANQERDFTAAAATLLTTARQGTIATIASGRPHAALVTFALHPDGSIILLLSNLSAHTRHLRADPACALLVTGTAASANPQTTPRLLLSGIAKIDADPASRDFFLKIHDYAELYANFADFNFWRLIPNDAHYIGGFAAAAQLEIAALHHHILSTGP